MTSHDANHDGHDERDGRDVPDARDAGTIDTVEYRLRLAPDEAHYMLVTVSVQEVWKGSAIACAMC